MDAPQEVRGARNCKKLQEMCAIDPRSFWRRAFLAGQNNCMQKATFLPLFLENSYLHLKYWGRNELS